MNCIFTPYRGGHQYAFSHRQTQRRLVVCSVRVRELFLARSFELSSEGGCRKPVLASTLGQVVKTNRSSGHSAAAIPNP